MRALGRRVSRLAEAPASVMLAGLALAVSSTGDLAVAQGKLEARYVVTLAGIPLGKGAWIVDIASDQFTAAASGATSGLIKIITSGQGSSASRGLVRRGNLVPQSYASNVQTPRWREEIRMNMDAGRVKDFAVEPQTPPHPDRVPLTEAHRRGAVDPMSAVLVSVPGNEQLLSPDVCAHKLSIFDGRMRYDLVLGYKRVEQVKAEKGYQGPAVVCAAYFRPIAGHVPHRPTVKYLMARQDMEVWFAPVLGTRVVVPFRVYVPTPLGDGVLQATQFVSIPQTAKLVPTSVPTR
ncbi:MAG: DUF3108 domain-containing protein [Proteobacteria bacterium]|nr:DUF3108 domain-containing protein [Pseudomonadota bacterium]